MPDPGLAFCAGALCVPENGQIVTPFCRMAETSSGSGFPETKENYLVMSDYVLRNFDEDMLYYSFGNAVAMIMAGHVKITTVAATWVPVCGLLFLR